jgi:hypothetical protein
LTDHAAMAVTFLSRTILRYTRRPFPAPDTVPVVT